MPIVPSIAAARPSLCVIAMPGRPRRRYLVTHLAAASSVHGIGARPVLEIGETGSVVQ